MGAVAGFVCAVFRLSLAEADRLRDLAIDWAHGCVLELAHLRDDGTALTDRRCVVAR